MPRHGGLGSRPTRESLRGRPERAGSRTAARAQGSGPPVRPASATTNRARSAPRARDPRSEPPSRRTTSCASAARRGVIRRRSVRSVAPRQQPLANGAHARRELGVGARGPHGGRERRRRSGGPDRAPDVCDQLRRAPLRRSVDRSGQPGRLATAARARRQPAACRRPARGGRASSTIQTQSGTRCASIQASAGRSCPTRAGGSAAAAADLAHAPPPAPTWGPRRARAYRAAARSKYA